MKASSISLERYISILMKGSWGFGKTLAASSFAVEGPVYIAYFDKKTPVELIHFYRNIVKRPELLDRIEYDIYSSANANEYLNKLISFIKDCRYTTIITDSVTNLTSAAVNWSMGFRDPKGGKKDKLSKDSPQLIPDFDEYKVETSLVTQALDICRTLPANIIFTAHPLPGIKVEGSGASMKVTKTNPIVTYGSKVAGIVPGNFSEIYHFAKRTDWLPSGEAKIKYLVNTEATGDEFAKSNIGLRGEFDITDKLFYEVWREKIADLAKETKENEVEQAKQSENVIPFTNQPSTYQPPTTSNQPTTNSGWPK